MAACEYTMSLAESAELDRQAKSAKIAALSSASSGSQAHFAASALHNDDDNRIATYFACWFVSAARLADRSAKTRRSLPAPSSSERIMARRSRLLGTSPGRRHNSR